MGPAAKFNAVLGGLSFLCAAFVVSLNYGWFKFLYQSGDSAMALAIEGGVLSLVLLALHLLLAIFRPFRSGLVGLVCLGWGLLVLILFVDPW